MVRELTHIPQTTFNQRARNNKKKNKNKKKRGKGGKATVTSKQHVSFQHVVEVWCVMLQIDITQYIM
jgi:hypothetical protein